jgi:non-specific serine/threonine protein kinase
VAVERLPLPLTPLVGRTEEITAVSALLNDSAARLVTLTGAGGVGKTRLALEVAAALRDRFADGVWFVGLAHVRDPALVIRTIADRLGVPEAGDQVVAAGLVAHLASRELLLVLDNFEQVTAAAPLLIELLGAAPGITILVTSRERLRVRGEQTVTVAPLPLPLAASERDEERVRLLSPDVAMSSPAVQLFVERAQAVQSDFALDQHNTFPVVQICGRLDGLPLALELAAARMAHISPGELVGRLDRRLTVLTGGARDLPDRQRTLRDTIAWSHDLLAPSEQALFRSLAVFAGGFTLDAAEKVAGSLGVRVSGDEPGIETGDGRRETGGRRLPDGETAGRQELLSPRHPDTPSPAVLDGIASLINKNLLRQVQGRAGSARFEMFETVREFALERLAESDEAMVRRRHADWCIDLAARSWEASWVNPVQLPMLDKMSDEHDNMRAALAWLAEGNDVVSWLNLMASCCPFWFFRSHRLEGRRWMERGLAALATSDVPLALRARVLHAAALLSEGESSAGPYLVESLPMWRQLGDQLYIGATLIEWGYLANSQGDYAHAAELCDEALATLDPKHTIWIAVAKLVRGRAEHGLGHLEAAAMWLQSSLDLGRNVDDIYNVGQALDHLALVALRRGNPTQAAPLLSESLHIWREVGRLECLAYCLGDVATLASATGQPAAARLWGAVTALRQVAGYEFGSPEREAFADAETGLRSSLGEVVFAQEFAAGRLLGVEEALAEATAVLAAAASALKATPASDPYGLTPREHDVLKLLVAGQTDREIAESLFISRHTAMKHVANILAKLEVSSRTAAATVALRDGLA